MTDVTAITRVQRAVDHYEGLGIARDTNADEVKRAYRALSLKLHPDRNRQPGAEAAFKVVGASHEALADEQGRAAYDRQLDEQQRGTQERSTPAKKKTRSKREAAEEAALERQLDAELEELRRREEQGRYTEWVANAHYEQSFLIKTVLGAGAFAALGMVLFFASLALPAGSSPTNSSGISDDGWLWPHVAWLGSFAGRLLLGAVGLVALVIATPLGLWALVVGTGKLCGFFFDLCELLFSRVLKPLVEDYLLSGPRVCNSKGKRHRSN